MSDWPDRVAVVPWRDSVVDAATGSMPTTSDAALLWWSSTLGPSAMLIARHLAAYATAAPVTWPLDELAQTFGIKLARCHDALDRLELFGVIARQADGLVAIRLTLPPLTQRQRGRLPRYLADKVPT